MDNQPSSAESVQQQCIFCHIASGKSPSHKIFEDEKVICVLDVKPAVLGHAILIPKEHYAVLPQIPDEIVTHLFLMAKKISQVMLRGLHVRGTTLFLANGAVAGQRAPHLLIHLIPREKNDGLSLDLVPQPSLVDSQRQLKVTLVGAASLLDTELAAVTGTAASSQQLQDVALSNEAAEQHDEETAETGSETSADVSDEDDTLEEDDDEEEDGSNDDREDGEDDEVDGEDDDYEDDDEDSEEGDGDEEDDTSGDDEDSGELDAVLEDDGEKETESQKKPSLDDIAGLFR